MSRDSIFTLMIVLASASALQIAGAAARDYENCDYEDSDHNNGGQQGYVYHLSAAELATPGQIASTGVSSVTFGSSATSGARSQSAVDRTLPANPEKDPLVLISIFRGCDRCEYQPLHTEQKGVYE